MEGRFWSEGVSTDRFVAAPELEIDPEPPAQSLRGALQRLQGDRLASLVRSNKNTAAIGPPRFDFTKAATPFFTNRSIGRTGPRK